MDSRREVRAVPARYRCRKQRDTAARGYTWNYKKARNIVLAEEPLCRDCLAKGLSTPAAEIHHAKKVLEHPELVADPENMMPLCVNCHRIRTLRGE